MMEMLGTIEDTSERKAEPTKIELRAVPLTNSGPTLPVFKNVTSDLGELVWNVVERIKRQGSTPRVHAHRARQAESDPVSYFNIPFALSELEAIELRMTADSPQDRDKIRGRKQWRREMTDLIRRFVLRELRRQS